MFLPPPLTCGVRVTFLTIPSLPPPPTDQQSAGDLSDQDDDDGGDDEHHHQQSDAHHHVTVGGAHLRAGNAGDSTAHTDCIFLQLTHLIGATIANKKSLMNV